MMRHAEEVAKYLVGESKRLGFEIKPHRAYYSDREGVPCGCALTGWITVHDRKPPADWGEIAVRVISLRENDLYLRGLEDGFEHSLQSVDAKRGNPEYDFGFAVGDAIRELVTI